MGKNEILNIKLKELTNEYSFVKSYFTESGLDYLYDDEMSINEIAKNIDNTLKDNQALTGNKFIDNFTIYFDSVLELLGLDKDDSIKNITIISGTCKNGVKENFEKLSINRGEIISIVGPTGSGKSRLLADIEWAADRDTPTNRQILVNNQIVDKKNRFNTANKLVAQLSQNMNFVMDLSVEEFLDMHAVSRMVKNKNEIIEKIFKSANYLAGEKFNLNQSITSLSGGQSRALMIADTAILSKSPIILIDEIENAGIDRKKALDLLLDEDKIVFIATHDPILSLMADKRIVIGNGGIQKIIVTTDEERKVLKKLNKLDFIFNDYRTKLRNGDLLN
ncbi:MAG: ABC transporter [Clostridiales bacterium]|nr:MAG: ABC transporter [Clostridiales bacterium]